MPLLLITHREIGWWLVGLNFNPKPKSRAQKQETVTQIPFRWWFYG
jgi:hypothetical protein